MNPPENRPDPEKPFEAPWEAEAFAMAVKLHERGAFTWSEWAERLGAELKAHPQRPYYENWLATLEGLVEAKSIMSQSERHQRIADWDRAARATPHGKPILLENGKPDFTFSSV